jgi:hypothetical protein
MGPRPGRLEATPARRGLWLQKRGPAPQRRRDGAPGGATRGLKASRATGWLALRGAPSPSLFSAGVDSPGPPVGSGTTPPRGSGEQTSGAFAPRE